MDLLWLASIFILGLTITLTFAQVFVNLASQLTKDLRISPLVIGLTVAGLGTSLPELAVTVNAVIRREPELAVGNLIGTNITNIGLVLALPFLIRPIRIGSTKSQRNVVVLFIVTLLFLVLVAAGQFNRFWGLLFIEGGIALLWWQVRQGLRGRTQEDAPLFSDLASESLRRKWKDLAGIVISLIGVLIGGRLLVESSIGIAAILHVSTSIIGLTIVALGTSIPELTTETMAARQGEVKFLLGQTIGSNLYNILFIAGIGALVTPFYFHNLIGIIFLLITTSLLLLIVRIHSGKYIARWWGGVLLGIYLVYVMMVVLAR